MVCFIRGLQCTMAYTNHRVQKFMVCACHSIIMHCNGHIPPPPGNSGDLTHSAFGFEYIIWVYSVGPHYNGTHCSEHVSTADFSYVEKG